MKFSFQCHLLHVQKHSVLMIWLFIFCIYVDVRKIILTYVLTLLRGWWGRCKKKSPEEGREGGEKRRAQRARRARLLWRARRGSPLQARGAV